MEISERNGRFFLFISECDEKGDFVGTPEYYPLHFDKEYDISFFYRNGIRTELLKDEDDETLIIFPDEDYDRIKGSFENHSCHLYY